MTHVTLTLGPKPRVDPITLAHMELVSGRKGDAAINAWLKFTGWPTGATRQIPVERRLQRAWWLARTVVEPSPVAAHARLPIQRFGSESLRAAMKRS